MAFLNVNFFSNTLGMQSTVSVLIPERPDKNRPLPTLYLLHGLSDDHSIWHRRTSIERYLDKCYLAVVMPNVHRSFYLDSDDGFSKYFSYITDELPQIMESYFNLSTKREDRFIAGLSMGGYGAMKSALLRPDRYAAAGSFSGVLDFVSGYDRWEELHTWVSEETANSASCNLFEAARLLVHSAKNNDAIKIPRIYQECGTEDFLYKDNTDFRDLAKEIGLEIEYFERPGSHMWSFWDECIRKFLLWLPISGNVEKTEAIGVE